MNRLLNLGKGSMNPLMFEVDLEQLLLQHH